VLLKIGIPGLVPFFPAHYGIIFISLQTTFFPPRIATPTGPLWHIPLLEIIFEKWPLSVNCEGRTKTHNHPKHGRYNVRLVHYTVPQTTRTRQQHTPWRTNRRYQE
jgi:hypothetical protein